MTNEPVRTGKNCIKADLVPISNMAMMIIMGFLALAAIGIITSISDMGNTVDFDVYPAIVIFFISALGALMFIIWLIMGLMRKQCTE